MAINGLESAVLRVLTACYVEKGASAEAAALQAKSKLSDGLKVVLAETDSAKNVEDGVCEGLGKLKQWAKTH